MKRIFLITFLVTAVGAAAQERVSHEECLKVALMLGADVKQLTGTPIPTDPDLKHPVAVRSGDFGGLVLPQMKLSPEMFSQASQLITPVGQLWLRKLAPSKDGQVVPADKLRIVQVNTGKAEEEAVCCALAISKGADGKLKLLVFGRDKKPLFRLPLKAISGAQEEPIEISAEKKDDVGLVTLKLLGKYETTIEVGPLGQ